MAVDRVLGSAGLQAGDWELPPNLTDPDLIPGFAIGAKGKEPGGGGLVVLRWQPPQR